MLVTDMCTVLVALMSALVDFSGHVKYWRISSLPAIIVVYLYRFITCRLNTLRHLTRCVMPMLSICSFFHLGKKFSGSSCPFMRLSWQMQLIFK